MKVDVIDRQRRRRVGRAALAAFVRRLARAMPAEADEVAVVLVGDAAMRRLNRRFRGIDRTTDVLAFPVGADPAPTGTRPLGDIVVSVPRAVDQARAAGHSSAREIRVLALHGYLHLLGYDHESDDGTMMRTQRRLERRLLPGRGRP